MIIDESMVKSEILSSFNQLKRVLGKQDAFNISLCVLSKQWLEAKIKEDPEIPQEYGMKLKTDTQIHEKDFLKDLLDWIREHRNYHSRLVKILEQILRGVSIENKPSINRSLIDFSWRMSQLNYETSNKIKDQINVYASQIGTQCGIVETPESIKEIIIKLLNWENISHIANFCSGLSSFEIYINNFIEKSNIKKEVIYYGEEVNQSSYLISELLMIVNDINNYQIENSDVLSHYNDMKFDFVFCDIPQDVKPDYVPNDQRFKFGVPSKNSYDWFFGQNTIFHLNKKGIGVVVGTTGTLVRKSDEGIRKNITEADLIECIISLPENLYEGKNVSSELIIFNNSKRESRKNKILFIDASKNSYRINRSQHALSEQELIKIEECYKNDIDISDFCRLVSIEKIKEYNYTLNPKEYLYFDILKNSIGETVLLKDIAKVTRGVQIRSDDIDELSNDPTHHLLNTVDLENGRVLFEDKSKIRPKKDDWSRKYEIRPYDIIITSRGGLKIALVDENYQPSFILANLTRIRVDPNKYNPFVLFEFLNSKIGKKMLEGIQTGTTVFLLNTAQLERLEIPLYEIEFLTKVGNELKNNRQEYETSLKEVEMKYQRNMNETMKNFSWSK